MKYLILWGTFIIIVLNGCRSSYITGSWKTEQPVPALYNKVLVLGLMGDEDSSLRGKMEDHMVGDLVGLGIQAISATRAFGTRAFEGLNEGEAIDKLRETGVEAVMTIVLLNKNKEKRIFEGNPRFWPAEYYNTRFWQYYDERRRSIYERDYYTINTRYLWESNFYNLKDQALLYTVQTQSFDPSTVESLAHEYGKLIIKNMTKKKIVQKQKAGTTRAF